MDAVTLIGFIVAGYAAFVTIAAVLGVVLKAPRPKWLDQVAWMLETGFQPAGDVVSNTSSRPPRILADVAAKTPSRRS